MRRIDYFEIILISYFIHVTGVESWHKRSNAPCIRISVVGEQIMMIRQATGWGQCS